MLEDVLKVVVWSFFAERLLQSALVGWGQRGRVGALEQVGQTNHSRATHHGNTSVGESVSHL